MARFSDKQVAGREEEEVNGLHAGQMMGLVTRETIDS